MQPRYQRVKHWIEEQLRNNAWKEGERLPGEAVLARSLDVSTITVRQALNALSQSGVLRREKGRGTFVARPYVRDGGSVASPSVSSVLSGRAVGVVIPEIPLISERKRMVMEVIEQEISKRGGRSLIFQHEEQSRGALREWMARHGDMCALILMEFAGMGFCDRVLPDALVAERAVVACEYQGSLCADRVVVDSGWGMHLAVEQLHRLGHRRIALAQFSHASQGHYGLAWIGSRNVSFLEACERFGLEANGESIITDDLPVRGEEDQVGVGARIAGRLGRKRGAYTAVIGVNDYVALGLWREVRRRGLMVSVVGFDNIPQASIENLTTLGVSGVDVGAAAVDLLEDALGRRRQSGSVYYQAVVRPNLISRESARPLVV